MLVLKILILRHTDLRDFQAARTILDVRSVTLYSQHRAPGDLDDLEVYLCVCLCLCLSMSVSAPVPMSASVWVSAFMFIGVCANKISKLMYTM